MKGLALETIAYFIIALIGVILLFMFVGTKISPSLRSTYCKLIVGLRGFLPLPSYLTPSLPTYCENQEIEISEECVIQSKDPDRIAFMLASYVIACWEITGKANVGENVFCYECYLERGVDGVVTWDMVRNYIEEYKPGYSNNVQWLIGDITSRVSVAIKYDGINKKVVVV